MRKRSQPDINLLHRKRRRLFGEDESGLTDRRVRRVRPVETPLQRENRLRTQRLRQATLRSNETREQREIRLRGNRVRNAEVRSGQSSEARDIRLAGLYRRYHQQIQSRWYPKENSAFSYDNLIDYNEDADVRIGSMSVVCRFCGALKFKNESLGLCCLNGKVAIDSILEPPQPLKNILVGTHKFSKIFLENPRGYNSAFQMTSFGAKSIGHGTFMPTYKVQGQVYHLAGSLLPVNRSEPKFLQIYFMGDSVRESLRRSQITENTDNRLITILQQMLHKKNRFVRSFKSTVDTMPRNIENFKVIIRADKKPPTEHSGRFNAPTTNEVAILIVGQDFNKRDIVLRTRDNQLQRISETHRAYDALQYPLIFPRGEDGYFICIPQVNPVTRVQSNCKMVSAMSFYAYRTMIRQNEFNPLHYFRGLLNQYWVDMYAKIETERLAFIRANQSKLRAENYISLHDAINNEKNLGDLGQLIILPSSFTGGPRYMHERTQDAMVYERNFGTPDLFITMTCNPKWPEISASLLEGQKSYDRHDIISRVFHLKVTKLLALITKKKIFGETIAHIYTIEWQKRGLPHVHLLVWLRCKIRSNMIDSVISAELPNLNQDPVLYNIVKKNMIHGPCGEYNINAPCMKSGKCCKKFPKSFVNETQTGADGYPKYRRRSPDAGGFTADLAFSRGRVMTIDNRWVVPYCPVLLNTFRCHINIEYCNSIKSIKYICKYVNKGSDQATFSVNKANDEIHTYQTGRYISTSEAVWRILSFPIHERAPTVVRMAVHLENEQRIFFTADSARDRLENVQNTTLMAFFDLCQEDDFARTLLYHEIPTYFTWNNRRFSRRKLGQTVEGYPGVKKSDALGRVYTVHPNNAECYYLRLLLHHVRGPTSFEALRTIDNVVYPTFQAACKSLGLLEDDTHWTTTLQEAVLYTSPNKLRELFSILLVFCHVSEPRTLWDKFKDELSTDILFRHRRQFPDRQIELDENIYNETLIFLEEQTLSLNDKKMTDFGLPSPFRDNSNVYLSREYLQETSYNTTELLNYVDERECLLVDDQKTAYIKILQSVQGNEGRLFFFDASGGTGKTFLINLLLSKVRSERKIALAVASSGIAATLLLNGKTAHAAFKLPLQINNDTSVCNISKQSVRAKLLQNCSLIVWDECTMANKTSIETLNRTLKDFRSNDRNMGGITVVFAGDFRQTLPVIPRGSKADAINACLKSSFLWESVEILPLKTNMRVYLKRDSRSVVFSDTLLQVGNGTYPEENGEINIASNLATVVPNLAELISKIYPNTSTLSNRTGSWFRERAILAPKNDRVNFINELILKDYDSHEYTYRSIDSVTEMQQVTNYPIEFLNSLNPPGLPPHILKLKIGTPIILLRNLNSPKLCNGTRLKITRLMSHLLEAEIITGNTIGEHVLIPRIPIIPANYPFEFKRIQFPVKLCFAMTINKSQGQTFEVAGIDLHDQCFSHGQLYVGCSRVSSEKKLFIHAPDGKTPNIVYKEIVQ